MKQRPAWGLVGGGSAFAGLLSFTDPHGWTYWFSRGDFVAYQRPGRNPVVTEEGVPDALRLLHLPVIEGGGNRPRVTITELEERLAIDLTAAGLEDRS